MLLPDMPGCGFELSPPLDINVTWTSSAADAKAQAQLQPSVAAQTSASPGNIQVHDLLLSAILG
jgi:hypothetical protein